MIDKVLFDLGNVLLRFDFGRTNRVLAEHGANLDSLNSPEMARIKDAYECGQLDESALFDQVVALSGYTGTREVFEAAWQDIFEANTPMVTFLQDLQQRGMPCYLLSNSNELHVSHIRSHYALLDSFTGTIFSHDAKMIKPNPKIFQKAISDFDLEPSKTVYIDDLRPNIDAGLAFGFRGIHYCPDHHEDTANELRELGLMVS